MTPVVNEFYRHKYGGIYFVDSVATHTTTEQRLVIYTHIFPFPEQTYARPIDEWTEDRFTLINYVEAQSLMRKDKVEAQLDIARAKAKR